MPKYSLRCTLSAIACTIASAVIGIDFSMTGKSVHAAVVDLTCPVGGETATYSPGITNTPQSTNVTIDGSLTTCVSVGDATIKSGSYNLKTQGERSCLPSPLNPYDITYKWNNGKTSTIHFVSGQNIKAEGETVVQTIGTVISGEFQGDQALRTAITPTLSPEQCLTPEGVTTNSGSATLTLTEI